GRDDRHQLRERRDRRRDGRYRRGRANGQRPRGRGRPPQPHRRGRAKGGGGGGRSPPPPPAPPAEAAGGRTRPPRPAPPAPDPTTAVAFQTDGTIVIAGSEKTLTNLVFAVARLDQASGNLIGTVQITSLGVPTFDAFANAVAVYQSGPNVNKIVAVGNVGFPGPNPDIGVTQAKADLQARET